MNDTVTLISILADATPFALMVFIVLGLLLFAGRVFIPGLRVTIEMFEAQRSAWESLIERLDRVNARLVEELDKDLKAAVEANAALEKRVDTLEAQIADRDKRIDTLEAQIADRDKRIDTLEAQIAELSKANEEKDRVIAKLREDLDEVKREREALAKQRDELLARMDAIDEKQNGESKAVEKPGEKLPEKEKSNP
jgi:chromosome segregation ATPase